MLKIAVPDLVGLLAVGAAAVPGHPLYGHPKSFRVDHRHILGRVWSCPSYQEDRSSHNGRHIIGDQALVNPMIALPQVFDDELPVVLVAPFAINFQAVQLKKTRPESSIVMQNISENPLVP